MIEIASSVLLCIGAFFYFAGTVGLLRFPDVYSRLHALTKADNLGLGCMSSGLVFACTGALLLAPAASVLLDLRGVELMQLLTAGSAS